MKKNSIFSCLLLCGVLATTACSTSTPDAPEKKPAFYNTFKAHRFFRGALGPAFSTVQGKSLEAAYSKAGFHFWAPPKNLAKFNVKSTMIALPVNGAALCEAPFQLHSAQVRDHSAVLNEPVEILDIGEASTPEPFEDVWDSFMSSKHRVFAYVGDGGDSKKNVASGWVSVWFHSSDEQPTLEKICAALSEGNFYFSRGPKFSSIVLTKNTLEISVEGFNPATDQVDFIGLHGKLLNRTNSGFVRYVLLGGEGYVRVHVRQGLGEKRRDAWTQSYFVKYE